MEWLNYHHLHYFWVITQEGGVARAAKRLRLSHSTLSTQLRSLEAFLGGELFERRGRRLVLTAFGEEMATYASEIFRLGGELVDVARGRASPMGTPLRIGVVASVPKTIVYRLLEPALPATDGAMVQVRQSDLGSLLEDLAANRVHLVVSDGVPSPGMAPWVHAHPLGQTDIFLYGSPALARRWGRDFPGGLEGAPLLFPGAGSTLRRRMHAWFADRGIHVHVTGEIDDAGMLRVFGGQGRGLFPVRSVLRSEVEEALRAVSLGRLDGLQDAFYLLSGARRVRHPAVAAMIGHVRETSRPSGRVRGKSRAG
jgi:LysR family transcriptional activator of nhaA